MKNENFVALVKLICSYTYVFGVRKKITNEFIVVHLSRAVFHRLTPETGHCCTMVRD